MHPNEKEKEVNPCDCWDRHPIRDVAEDSASLICDCLCHGHNSEVSEVLKGEVPNPLTDLRDFEEKFPTLVDWKDLAGASFNPRIKSFILQDRLKIRDWYLERVEEWAKIEKEKCDLGCEPVDTPDCPHYRHEGNKILNYLLTFLQELKKEK